MKQTAIWIVAAMMMAVTSVVRAADTEGCLQCHQYRGLSRVDDDGKSIRLFYVDPAYYSLALGPHAELKCTDCHVRDEVRMFPHQVKTPVDCTRECHIDRPNEVERRFRHDRVETLLGKSVHNLDNLKTSNKLLGSPLRDGQSGCLLCHDEPAFSRGGVTAARAEAPIGRCNTCHDENLPIDTRQFYWHVMARSKPARSSQDMVRVCAMCHSNQAILEQFHLPDATVSYLSSFHGKSTLLGREDAATCLDCHVTQTRNIHAMLGPDAKLSPVNLANLPDTCRQPACHRAAGAQLSSAAVHLDLTRTHGIEFFIACIFIGLIVFTFGPSLLMTVLKMLEIVTGRGDPEEHEHHHLAVKLLETPAGRAKLERFTVHQRLQHWLLVICFTTLVLTGFPIKFAGSAWAGWVINLFGGLGTARRLHHYAGAVLILGLAYHLIYIFYGLRRKQKADGKGFIYTLMNLPMMVTPKDMVEMNGLMLYLLRMKKERPVAGRFNPEEKFEYIGVFWGSIVLGTTGTLMWFNAWTTQHLPGRILTIAMLFHTMEAFLALLHVGIVHMVSVIFSPGVFPLSKAMFTGQTPVGELVEAHAGMLMEAAKSTEANHG